MCNAREWPQQCWKCCANGSNIVALRFGNHGTKEMLGVVGSNVWPVSNFAQQLPTTHNNMQQSLQTDTICNIQQYWELLANNVVSILAFARGYTYESKIIPIIIVSSLYSVKWFMQCLEKFKETRYVRKYIHLTPLVPSPVKALISNPSCLFFCFYFFTPSFNTLVVQ